MRKRLLRSPDGVCDVVLLCAGGVVVVAAAGVVVATSCIPLDPVRTVAVVLHGPP